MKLIGRWFVLGSDFDFSAALSTSTSTASFLRFPPSLAASLPLRSPILPSLCKIMAHARPSGFHLQSKHPPKKSDFLPEWTFFPTRLSSRRQSASSTRPRCSTPRPAPPLPPPLPPTHVQR